MTTVDDLLPEVEKAAQTATRSWSGVLDSGDVVQDIWVKILAAPKTLPSLLSYEADQRGKVLRAIARQVAQQETADYEAFSGNTYYSTDDVSRILSRGATEGTPGSASHAEWIDLRAGLEALSDSSPWHAELIFARYVADDLDMTSATTRKELTRARGELTRQMNRAHNRASVNYDGPGGR